MKKLVIFFTLAFCLTGCGKKTAEPVETPPETETNVVIVSEEEMSEVEEETTAVEEDEKIHTIRINGINYYSTNRAVSNIEEATEDIVAGEITSSVESNELPVEDNQSNFGKGYLYQQRDENYFYVKIDEKWHLFCSNEDGENTISFQDKIFMKSELSSSTLEWLEKYNELTENEQLSMDGIPAELIDEINIDYEVMEVEETEVETETEAEDITIEVEDVEVTVPETEEISETSPENAVAE